MVNLRVPNPPELIPTGYECVHCHAKEGFAHKMSCDPPYKLRKRMKRGEKNKDLRAQCAEYIAKTRTLDEAKELAKRDGFSANFSVWASAFGESLKKGKLPWETP